MQTLQINLGYTCNLSCNHCHVNAGPNRREQMERANIDLVLDVLVAKDIRALDLTGGAPELNPHFRRFVTAARALGKRIIVRTNLAVLHESGTEDLPRFYREQEVELVASLPCYQRDNVDAMRGSGTFEKCIASLRSLNALGYGVPGGPPLHLVYNPAGPFLPPHQGTLEQDYRRERRDRPGVVGPGCFLDGPQPAGVQLRTVIRGGEHGCQN